jgi:hypothetical protein
MTQQLTDQPATPETDMDRAERERTGTARTPGSDAPTSTADLLGTANRQEREPGTTPSPKYVTGEDRPTDDRDTGAASAPATRATPPPAAAAAAAEPQATTTPLLAEAEAQAYRTRWQDIQGQFVDEPRQAVEQGDQLVAEVIKHVAEVFAKERSSLEEQWSKGGEADTEDLRVALQRYRAFFERLLVA